MWMILQHDRPDDFVIATGEQHSVRTFCEKAFETLGITLEWVGIGLDERGVVTAVRSTSTLEGCPTLNPPEKLKPGSVVVSIDPAYFRPTEVESLLGDAAKARRELGWRPEVSFNELVREMIVCDLNLASRDALCHNSGFNVPQSCEAAM
jgi:GDPmannose 4,6-dehydratase